MTDDDIRSAQGAEDEVELSRLLQDEIEQYPDGGATVEDDIGEGDTVNATDRLVFSHLRSVSFDVVVQEEVDFLLGSDEPIDPGAQQRMIEGATRALSYRKLLSVPSVVILEGLQDQLKEIPSGLQREAREFQDALSSVVERKVRPTDLGAERIADWIYTLDLTEDWVLAALEQASKGDRPLARKAKAALMGRNKDVEMSQFRSAVYARLRELRAGGEDSASTT